MWRQGTGTFVGDEADQREPDAASLVEYTACLNNWRHQTKYSKVWKPFFEKKKNANATRKVAWQDACKSGK